MLAREKGRSRWLKCPNCGHKLFKVISEEPITISISSRDFVGGFPHISNGSIEIKCHSCKEIVTVAGGAK